MDSTVRGRDVREYYGQHALQADQHREQSGFMDTRHIVESKYGDFLLQGINGSGGSSAKENYKCVLKYCYFSFFFYLLFPLKRQLITHLPLGADPLVHKLVLAA